MTKALPEEIWNEAILTREQLLHLQRGLPYLVAYNRDHDPHVIGTAFVIAAEGSTAVGCTAAHNFDGVQRAQNPRLRAHATTPREFNAMQPLDLDPQAVRAAVVDGDVPEMAELTWAVRDERTDLAFFGLKSQAHMPGYFKTHFPFASAIPAVGDIVCVLGYRNSVASEETVADSALRRFELRRELVLRRGRIVAHHEIHIGCRGPCAEITIPTFPGMSGGPVFALPNDGDPMRPFGIISADREVDDPEERMDRSKSGATLVALPPLVVTPGPDGKQDVVITLPGSSVLTQRK